MGCIGASRSIKDLVPIVHRETPPGCAWYGLQTRRVPFRRDQWNSVKMRAILPDVGDHGVGVGRLSMAELDDLSSNGHPALHDRWSMIPCSPGQVFSGPKQIYDSAPGARSTISAIKTKELGSLKLAFSACSADPRHQGTHATVSSPATAAPARIGGRHSRSTSI